MDAQVLWRVIRFAALQARLAGLSTATVTEHFVVILDDGTRLGIPSGLLRPYG